MASALAPQPAEAIERTRVSRVDVAAGRGGSEHKYFQELIRRWGHTNGWLATVEQSILDGLGSVDVALERDGVRVACEISVASKTAYEIDNVRKCVAAGFDHVVAVVAEQREVNRRRAAFSKALGDEAERLVVLGPDGVFAHLATLTADHPAPPKESTVRGYAVTVKRSKATPDDERRRTIGRTMVDALKRLRGKA
jgi:hypothetical protein